MPTPTPTPTWGAFAGLAWRAATNKGGGVVWAIQIPGEGVARGQAPTLESAHDAIARRVTAAVRALPPAVLAARAGPRVAALILGASQDQRERARWAAHPGAYVRAQAVGGPLLPAGR